MVLHVLMLTDLSVERNLYLVMKICEKK